jgi:hypothetical protein
MSSFSEYACVLNTRWEIYRDLSLRVLLRAGNEGDEGYNRHYVWVCLYVPDEPHERNTWLMRVFVPVPCAFDEFEQLAMARVTTAFGGRFSVVPVGPDADAESSQGV